MPGAGSATSSHRCAMSSRKLGRRSARARSALITCSTRTRAARSSSFVLPQEADGEEVGQANGECAKDENIHTGPGGATAEGYTQRQRVVEQGTVIRVNRHGREEAAEGDAQRELDFISLVGEGGHELERPQAHPCPG